MLTMEKTVDVNPYDKFYEVARQIPYGKVATYGQIAALAGYPGYARQVGYALYRLEKGTDVPWQRVINAKGEISYSFIRMGGDNLQRQMLEDEGIEFNKKDKISLKVYQWQPVME